MFHGEGIFGYAGVSGRELFAAGAVCAGSAGECGGAAGEVAELKAAIQLPTDAKAHSHQLMAIRATAPDLAARAIWAIPGPGHPGLCPCTPLQFGRCEALFARIAEYSVGGLSLTSLSHDLRQLCIQMANNRRINERMEIVEG